MFVALIIPLLLVGAFGAWSAAGLVLWHRNKDSANNTIKYMALVLASGPLVWLFFIMHGMEHTLAAVVRAFESWIRR